MGFQSAQFKDHLVRGFHVQVLHVLLDQLRASILPVLLLLLLFPYFATILTRLWVFDALKRLTALRLPCCYFFELLVSVGFDKDCHLLFDKLACGDQTSVLSGAFRFCLTDYTLDFSFEVGNYLVPVDLFG